MEVGFFQLVFIKLDTVSGFLPAFTCSESTMETPEQSVESVES